MREGSDGSGRILSSRRIRYPVERGIRSPIHPSMEGCAMCCNHSNWGCGCSSCGCRCCCNRGCDCDASDSGSNWDPAWLCEVCRNSRPAARRRVTADTAANTKPHCGADAPAALRAAYLPSDGNKPRASLWGCRGLFSVLYDSSGKAGCGRVQDLATPAGSAPGRLHREASPLRYADVQDDAPADHNQGAVALALQGVFHVVGIFRR